MGKCLMLAVAGSGKTTHLINSLNLEQRFLLVTYTRNNFEHLRLSVIKRFGYLPNNIRVLNYFHFLYSFCFKPFAGLVTKTRGICFDVPPDYTRFQRGKSAFYKTKEDRMYYNRIALFCKEKFIERIKDRLDKYYDYLFIDEVQDLAGHDFNLLLSILPERCETLCVGDFYQHTFDTSLDGNVNKSLYDNYKGYIKRWRQAEVEIDTETLSRTYRCSENICRFVQQMGIEILSTGVATGNVRFVEDEAECDAIAQNSDIPKLVYQNSSKYHCTAMNWGASKGLDHFVDVCVVLNANSFQLYRQGHLKSLNPRTKNKLYVACTRAHKNLYLMSEEMLRNYRIENLIQKS